MAFGSFQGFGERLQQYWWYFTNLFTASKDVLHVLITADTVNGVTPAGYWKRGQAVQFWEAWATEEAAHSKKL